MALTYKTITEVLDFGPHITKIILETGRPLTGAKLDPAQFSVYVERTAKPGEEFTWPKFTGLPPTVTGLPSKSSLHSLFSM